MNPNLIYPRAGDRETVYLKNVVNDPSIIVGDYTMYNDFAHDPREFAANNVLYHYYVNRDRLIIGKYCSIACGAKFLFNSANHSLRSLSTYPFPIFYDEWGLDVQRVTDAWDNKGDIVVGNDVWIGYEAVILSGRDHRRRRHSRRPRSSHEGRPALRHSRRRPGQNNTPPVPRGRNKAPPIPPLVGLAGRKAATPPRRHPVRPPGSAAGLRPGFTSQQGAGLFRGRLPGRGGTARLCAHALPAR